MTNYTEIFDVILVGGGLAAEIIRFNLPKHLNILQIYDDELALPCSLSTTATISLNGIEKNISPRGDELYESYHLFLDFFSKNPLPMIEKVPHYHAAYSDKEREMIARRFGEVKEIKTPLFKDCQKLGFETTAYVINPKDYLAFFRSGHCYTKDIITEVLVGDGLNKLIGQGNNPHCYTAKKVIFCLGAYQKIFENFLKTPDLHTHSEVVLGSYLEKKININCPSFFTTYNGHSFLYRNYCQTMIIGSTQYNSTNLLPDRAALKEIFTLIQEAITISLGNFDEWQIHTGLRHKYKQRRMCFSEQNKSLLFVSGMYKNGFTLPFLASKKVNEWLML